MIRFWINTFTYIFILVMAYLIFSLLNWDFRVNEWFILTKIGMFITSILGLNVYDNIEIF